MNYSELNEIQVLNLKVKEMSKGITMFIVIIAWQYMH